MKLALLYPNETTCYNTNKIYLFQIYWLRLRCSVFCNYFKQCIYNQNGGRHQNQQGQSEESSLRDPEDPKYPEDPENPEDPEDPE